MARIYGALGFLVSNTLDAGMDASMRSIERLFRAGSVPSRRLLRLSRCRCGQEARRVGFNFDLKLRTDRESGHGVSYSK